MYAQDARKNFNWWMEKLVWLLARAHVKLLVWTSTAAVGNLGVHKLAGLLSIPLSSRRLAPGLTARHMMMGQALLPARLTTIP